MKKGICVLALAAALVSASPASAQGFALFGSYWDTDEAEEGLGGGINLSFGNELAFDLRASYYQELSNNKFEHVVIDNADLLRKNGLSILPVEVGLRYNFQPDGRVNPHIGGGVGYYILDTEIGDPKDEVGYYALAGATFRGNSGPGFYIEAVYRKAEGTVEIDPEDLGDIDDVEFDGEDVDLDLDGFGVNAGIIWRW